MDTVPIITDTIRTVDGRDVRGHIDDIVPVAVEGNPEEPAFTVLFRSPSGEHNQAWVSPKEAARLHDAKTLRQLNQEAEAEDELGL